MEESRHTIVCRVAQEAGAPHREYINRKKENVISHLCSSVIPYPIGAKFATDVPTNYGSLHTKFEDNRSSHFRDTSEHNFVLISSFFSSTSFRTLRKIRHKTRIRAQIGITIGTLEGLIKADLSTNFGRNRIEIHEVKIDFSRKIRSKVCHAHRVNPLKE